MRNKNLERHAECGNLQNVELEEPHLHNKITPQLEQDALPGAIVDENQPSDSVSNVSNKRHGSTSRTSTTSSTTSACVKAEAEMAALLARQKLLKEKYYLEQQEEEIRKRKEQFELEMEIAASVAKVNVLRASRSGLQSSISYKSDGMMSSCNKMNKGGAHSAFNADANSFVPEGQKIYEHPTANNIPDSCLTGAKPKERKYTVNVESQTLQQRPTEAGMAQNTQPNVLTSSQFAGAHASVPVTNDGNNLLSVMARQNEITAMLVQQQNLSSLPNKEIQVFDGDPLLYHTFMRAFEHAIEEKTRDARDCLHFLEQYTRSQPRELVRSCQQMAADRGYIKAKALLE